MGSRGLCQKIQLAPADRARVLAPISWSPVKTRMARPALAATLADDSS